jgi:CheY-like chemotaxis protein
MARDKSIVIVDDEIETVEMFSEMMRLGGFQVYKSIGGAKAIELISETRPSVVLLDLMMADVSGLDILNYIRRDPGLEKTPVIVVTAKSFPEDIRTCMEAGASLFLEKPVAYKDLRKAVEQMVGNQ